MTIRIPSPDSRRHSQLNRNDVTGTIQMSKNINLDEEAYIKLAPKTVAFFTTDDDAAFDRSDAINVGDGEILINSDQVFTGDLDLTTNKNFNNRSGDTNAPSPSVEDDVIYFNGVPVVSDGSSVSYEGSSGVWTDITGLTSASGPTSLAVFREQNSLLRGRGNKVDRIDSSWTVQATLTIPAEYRVSSMDVVGNTAYIGTRHDADGEAAMFLWNGTGSSPQSTYGVESFEISSVKSGNSSVVVVTADGRYLRFNGGGFTELAVWPVFMTSYQFGRSSSDYPNVTNRGMAVDGNLTYINISSELEDWRKYLQNFSSGVWCFDPSVGLYHRYSPSYTRLEVRNVNTSGVNTTTNVITPDDASFETPVTGTPVMYSSDFGTFIGGLKENTVYYTIYNDADSFKLATSYANAIDGVAVEITGTGNSAQDFVFFTTYDYGQQYYGNRAAVAILNSRHYDNGFAGPIAMTAEVDVDGATAKTVLCTYNSLLPNRGYFVTPKLYSVDKTDKYGVINLKHKPLADDDSFVVKYKTKETLGFPIGIEDVYESENIFGTWTSTTTFTTTLEKMENAEVGHEVEIISGQGAGFLAHISAITEDSGTYTVTLDEAFPWATNALQFRFIVDTWKKLGTIDKNRSESSLRLDVTGEFLELKIEMRGVETTLVDIIINDKSYRKMV